LHQPLELGLKEVLQLFRCQDGKGDRSGPARRGLDPYGVRKLDCCASEVMRHSSF
jgi:hypothetical protein